jgi:hypothetical protein
LRCSLAAAGVVTLSRTFLIPLTEAAVNLPEILTEAAAVLITVKDPFVVTAAGIPLLKTNVLILFNGLVNGKVVC